MIIFEGDFVRLTGESHWLRVEEIVFFDSVASNNCLLLSDGYTVPAPISNYIDEVRSEDEQMELYAAEVIEAEAPKDEDSGGWRSHILVKCAVCFKLMGWHEETTTATCTECDMALTTSRHTGPYGTPTIITYSYSRD